MGRKADKVSRTLQLESHDGTDLEVVVHTHFNGFGIVAALHPSRDGVIAGDALVSVQGKSVSDAIFALFGRVMEIGVAISHLEIES